MSITQVFPGKSREQWLSDLEKRAKSDASIRKQLADAINLKVEITEATSQLFSPVTTISQKQLELQTKLGEEASKAARKQFLATNSTAVDQALQNERLLSAVGKESLEKLTELIKIRERYIEAMQDSKGGEKKRYQETLLMLDDFLKAQKATAD